MEQEKDIFAIPHFKDYWFIIVKNKKVVMISVVLPVLIAFLGLSRKEPVYQARAKVLLESEVGIYTDTAKRNQMVGTYKEDFVSLVRKYQNEYELMRSADVSEKAAEMLGWQGKDKDALRSVQVNPVFEAYQLTNICYIVATSPDPQKAMDMANYTAKAYLTVKGANVRNRARKIYEIYSAQAAELKKKLRDSEIAFDEFKTKHNIIGIEDINITSSSTQRLTQEYVSMRGQIKKLDLLLKSLKNMKPEEDVSNIYGIIAADYPSAVNRNLHEQMVERERKLSGLLAIYMEKHPLVIQQQAQIEELKKSLKDDFKNTIANLDTVYNMLKAEEENIMYSLGLKNPDLGEAKTQYYTLEQEVSSTRALYDNLISGMKELNIYEDMSTLPEAKVLMWAELPTSPMSQRDIIFFFSPLLGLFFGISLAFFFEYMDNTIKTEADVKQYLGLSTIGIIPHIDEAGEDGK